MKRSEIKDIVKAVLGESANYNIAFWSAPVSSMRKFSVDLSGDVTFAQLGELSESLKTDLIDISPGEGGYYGDFTSGSLTVTMADEIVDDTAERAATFARFGIGAR